MMLSKKIIVLLTLCFATGLSIAQKLKKESPADQYRAINWTMNDGLSSNIANTMFKDAKGFLWTGSMRGELCRFDGNVFKKYLPDQQKREAINSDAIFSFEEDSLHNIWIGTAIGLSRYDFKADTFTNFSPFIDSAFPALAIAPFWATNDEIFCMEPGPLITAFNIHTLIRRKLGNLPKEVEPLIHYWNTNKSFFDARSNCIWMLSYRQSGGLEQIFLDGKKPQHYSWPYYRNSPYYSTNLRHGAEDMRYDAKRNSIWINSDDGLLEFSLDDKQFHHIEALNEFIKLKDYDRYVGLDIDKDGRVWLATKPKGILIYDPKTERVRQLFSDPDLQQKTGEVNLHIYCDRDGIVWTSYYDHRGIYELLPFIPPVKRYAPNPKLKDSLSNKSIYTIVPAAHGQMWIGTDDGLNIFDPNTEKFEVLREKDLPGIRENAIIPLHIDTIRRKAWLIIVSPGQIAGTDIYEMDIKTRKCRPIIFRDKSKRFDTLWISPSFTRPYKNGLLVCDENYGFFEIKGGSLFADLVTPFKKEISRFVLEEDRFIFLRKFDTNGSLPPILLLNIKMENG